MSGWLVKQNNSQVLIPNGLSQSSTADNAPAIQAAIDQLTASGGGIVFIPAGTYRVGAGANASAGSIRIKNDVTLRGAGMDVTNIKVLDTITGDITGIVRTPTGESTTNCGVEDLTLDGNRSVVTGGDVIGFFCGVTPANVITQLSRTDTIATAQTVFTTALTTGQTVYLFGAHGDTSGDYNGDKTITRVVAGSQFEFAITSAAIATASTSHTFNFYKQSEALSYDYDIFCRRVRIQNCSEYGFDPHERTRRLLFEDCVANGNGLDGYVADYIVEGIYKDSFAYSNDRHGFNLTTSSNEMELHNCFARNNTSNGVTVQQGSGNIEYPAAISIIGGKYHDNTLVGVQVGGRARTVTVQGVHAYKNGRQGIALDNAIDCVIVNNQVYNNSQTSAGASDGIYASACDNVLVQGNNIYSNVSAGHRNSIRDSSSNDHMRYLDNMCRGANGDAGRQIQIASRNAVVRQTFEVTASTTAFIDALRIPLSAGEGLHMEVHAISIGAVSNQAVQGTRIIGDFSRTSTSAANIVGSLNVVLNSSASATLTVSADPANNTVDIQIAATDGVERKHTIGVSFWKVSQ